MIVIYIYPALYTFISVTEIENHNNSGRLACIIISILRIWIPEGQSIEEIYLRSRDQLVEEPPLKSSSASFLIQWSLNLL